MRWSNVLLVVGMVALLTGAVMSYMKLQPYSDYVLVAGAVLVIFRGALHSRERAENIEPRDEKDMKE